MTLGDCGISAISDSVVSAILPEPPQFPEAKSPETIDKPLDPLQSAYLEQFFHPVRMIFHEKSG